jgi:hypothetical protein
MAVTAQQAIKKMASSIKFQTHGHLSGGYDWHDNYTIYSYDTAIARVSKRGQVWVTTRWYSRTTNKHIRYVLQAFDRGVVVYASDYEVAKGTTKWRDLDATLPAPAPTPAPAPAPLTPKEIDIV